MLNVLILCHGNICRSPIAEVLLEAAIGADPTLAGRVIVTSAGTSDEHLAEGMHEHSATLLAAKGLRTAHRARQLTIQIADRQDLILAADRWNLRNAKALVTSGTRRAEVRLLRDFDPAAAGQDLDDPWNLPMAAYERAAAEIGATIPGLLSTFRERL